MKYTVGFPGDIFIALAVTTFLALAATTPALSCVPEEKRIVRYCRDQPPLARLFNVVWPDSTPYQVAVVAGVARYPNLPEREQLPPVNHDVDTLRKMLIDKFEFDEVIVLKDQDFSLDNLRYIFSNYIPGQLQAQRSSQVLFAYSGHGADYRGTGYLFFSNTTTIDPHSPSDLAHALDMDELKVIMKNTVRASTHFLALLNSCKGGYFVEGGQFTFGGDALSARGAHGITAGGRENYVHAKSNVGSGQGSVFFEMLFAALGGERTILNGIVFENPALNDGILDTVSLSNFLHNTVRTIENYTFGPQMGRLDRGTGRGEGYFFFITNQDKAKRALQSRFPESWSRVFGPNHPYQARGWVDIRGQWLSLGRPIPYPAQINDLDSETLLFINERKGASTGKRLNANTVQADGWGNITAELRLGGKLLLWSNGTWWSRDSFDQIRGSVDKAHPLTGTWRFAGHAVSVAWPFPRLLFTNADGEMSFGKFIDDTTVEATDWGKMRGRRIEAGSVILWENGTWWGSQ
jgi:hypothetical protein